MAEKADTIDMAIQVQGKKYPVTWKNHRFERTIDRVDADIHRGKMTFKELMAKYADSVAGTNAPKVDVKPTAKGVTPPAEKPATPAASNANKAEQARKIFDGYAKPQDAMKAIMSELGITAANARYYVMKFGKSPK